MDEIFPNWMNTLTVFAHTRYYMWSRVFSVILHLSSRWHQ
jgi:hypothetical protein